MDKETLWKKILQLLKTEVDAGHFRTFFSQTAIEEITGDTLTIAVPSAFIKGELLRRHEQIVKEAVKKTLGRSMQLDFKIDSSRFLKHIQTKDPEDFFQAPAHTSTPNTVLNTKYSIENFVVGLTNNLAFAAAQAVITNPGLSYNPLFIYGPSGVGKTHLMQAIGNALLKNNSYLKIVYVSSEKFMNDFVESLQTKQMGNFRSKYRNCDLFLIDDVQFISGRDAMQEEFFHTFNEIYSKNLQIVLTSDKPPNEISKLEPRLLSRFQGGLMVDIQLPDFDTRMAILKAKLKEKNEDLPEEILHLIAENTESNTRELEGKLIQVLQLKLQGQDITPELITQKLLVTPKPLQKLDQKKVLAQINTYFNIKMHELTGPRRQKELVLPRQIAMYILYQDCGLPFEKIGEVLGGRDHTTILHGVRKIEQAVQRDREVQRLLVELKQQLAV